MATGITRISDVIVPARFTGYALQRTEEKSRLVRSGAVVRDPALDALLATGGGITFNVPSYRPLDQDDSRVSGDNPANVIPDDGTGTPPNVHRKIGTSQETAVRLERNQSWSTMDLTAALAGADPMAAIGNQVADYWNIEDQKILVATMQGVFADNDAAPTGGDTHVQGDLTLNISGASYNPGVTDFSAEAFIDTTTLLGDSMDDLGLILCHSVVYNRMKKNDLIDFVRDSEGGRPIPMYQGKMVIVDDAMPNPAGRAGVSQTAAGIYHTWVLGAGAIRLGFGSPAVPTEIERKPSAGNGGGQEFLYNRVVRTMHPVGHAFIAAASGGGPDYTATAGNLAHLDSWRRVFPQRKQIKVARLITREA